MGNYWFPVTREDIIFYNILKQMENEGFSINEYTFSKCNISDKSSINVYFDVDRQGRSDEDIDYLARKHKVEFIFLTGCPIIHIKYRIKSE